MNRKERGEAGIQGKGYAAEVYLHRWFKYMQDGEKVWLLSKRGFLRKWVAREGTDA